MDNVSSIDIVDQAITNLMTEYNHGDIIPIQWLRDNLSVNYPKTMSPDEFTELQFNFFGKLTQLRKMLLKKYGIMLHNIRAVGYLIVDPEDQAELAYECFLRKMEKEQNVCLNYLDNLDQSKLTKRKRVEATALRKRINSIKF